MKDAGFTYIRLQFMYYVSIYIQYVFMFLCLLYNREQYLKRLKKEINVYLKNQF